MNKKQVTKLIVFLLIFSILFTATATIVREKWTTGNSEDLVVDEFFSLPEDSVELFFMGSSQIGYGVAPILAYEEYGVSAYSIASGNMCPLIQYYWLLDAFKTQSKVKTLVFDTSMLFEPEGETRYRRALNSMKWSVNKLKAIWAHGQDPLAEDGMELYLLDFLRYHSRWNEVDEGDFTYWFDEYNFFRGSRLSSDLWKPDMPYEEFIIDNDPEDSEEDELNELQFGYFEKILALCQERGMDIVLVKTPKESWCKEGSIFVEKYAEEHNLPFLDFSDDEGMKELNVDYYGDLKDKDHFNARGAVKFTRYMMDYLTKRVDFTDFREVEGFEIDKLDLYHNDLEDKMLQTCTSVDEFFTYLDSEQYEVVIQSTADITHLWTDEYQAYFDAMDVTIDISEMAGKNYVIVIRNGKCDYEEVSEEKIEYEGLFFDEKTFKTESQLGISAFSTKMEVKGKKEDFEGSGMNILIRSVNNSYILARSTLYEENGALAYKNIE